MYDAIVVGARCAGSPTAMLLARRGYRVLLVDKATFPSDTVSTHVIWPHGAEVMERWGLLDRLASTNCPPIALDMSFDVGPFALKGGVRTANGGRGGFCPRRTLLDKILLDAAIQSGAEFRDAFTIDQLIEEGGRVAGIRGRSRRGGSVEERAQIVIGADGVHSFVAKAVQAREYDALPPLVTFFYSYFSGTGASDIEQYIGLPNQGAAYFPTNDGLTVVISAWQSHRFSEIRADIESNVLNMHRQIPGLAERLDGARREEKWVGTAGVPNLFRTPFGPGWALVGDAGHSEDPITGQGISDAFIDAENLAEAVDEGLSGRRPILDALADYESRRNDRVTPLHHFTCGLAHLEPPPPEIQQLFGALHGSQEATDDFFSALTGATPLPEFMDPANLARILAAAETRV
jgi:2-polyprenyl-6-methoxyphenol hydroxylase-like FAD-dependent oxidoreductase